MDPHRICFVSARNSCRSPLAEAFCPTAIGYPPLAGLVVESADILSSHMGEPMDPRARAALIAAGHRRLPEHRARQFERGWFDSFDLVIAMDGSIYSALYSIAPTSCPAALQMLPDHYQDWTLDVPDPHGGSDTDFVNCLQLIKDGLHDLVLDTEVHLGLCPNMYPGDGQ